MKVLCNILLTCFVLFFSLVANSQIEKIDKLKDFQILESQTGLINVSKKVPANGNQIFIQQVGVDNQINFEIAATSSKVNYSQEGNANIIDVSISSKTYNSNVFQAGSDNKVVDYLVAPSDDVVLNLTQNGKFQNFERYGSNSIGDKLEFKMNGDFNSIIIRNYK